MLEKASHPARAGHQVLIFWFQSYSLSQYKHTQQSTTVNAQCPVLATVLRIIVSLYCECFCHFGGIENGIFGARIKILRPLFNTNLPPKPPKSHLRNQNWPSKMQKRPKLLRPPMDDFNFYVFSMYSSRRIRESITLALYIFCLKIPSGLMCCAEDVVPRCALAVELLM